MIIVDKMQLASVVTLVFTFVLQAACSGPVNDNAEPQRDSLRNVYYRDGPAPPAPSADEIADAEKAVRNAQSWERATLQALYPGDVELWAYAIRDTDGDGIKDFRVSDYYGRFLEGDTDVDGDGIDNVFDTTPFSANTSDQAELVAPANWAMSGKPDVMAESQRELLVDNRILLVERSASFTPELTRSVRDVITRVYRSIFSDNGTLSTLRLIAAEEASLLFADSDEGSGDFAQVFAATQTMEVYRPGIDAPAVIQLGFLIHEIGHNVQFEMDFDARRQEEIMRRNVFVAEHFNDLVAGYGWTKVDYEPDPESEFTLFRPQYISPDSYGYLYLDKTPEEWAVWLEEIYAEVGEDAYLTDPRLVELHVLGDYSLSGPWEWYSDHLIAYVYLAMIDSLQEDCSASGWDALRHSFQNDVVRKAWPYFRFENARGAPVQKHLAETFPLDPADVEYLAETYLGGLIVRYCAQRDSPASGVISAPSPSFLPWPALQPGRFAQNWN